MNNDIVILREAIKKIIPMLAGKGLIVTQMGTQAYVQPHPVTGLPHRVNVPLLPDNAEPDFVVAIQGFIDHEVAHVLFTDFLFKAHEKSKRLHNLHNIVEDTMIERLMGEEFPGSKRNIARLREYFLRNVTAPAIAKARSNEESFAYLTVVMMRALAGHIEFQQFMDDNGYWQHPLVKVFMDRFPQQSKDKMPCLRTTEETYDIAVEMLAILNPPPPPAPPQPEPEEEKEEEQGEGSDEEQTGDCEGDGEREHTEDNDKASGGEGESEEEKDEEDAGDGESEGEGQGEESQSEEDQADNADGNSSSESDGDETGEEDAGAGSDDKDADREDGADDDADDADGAGQSSADEDDGADEKDGESASADGTDENDADEEGGSKEPQDAEAGESADDADDGEGDDEGKGDRGSDGADDDTEKGDSGEENGDSVDVSNLAIENDADDNDGEDGEGDEDAGSTDLQVAGLGFDPTANPFSKLDEDAFEEKDLSSALVKIIVKQAIEACKAADYSVFTREYDVIRPVKVPDTFNSKYIVELEDQTRSLTGVMQKDIERMMAAQSRVFNVAGQRSGRLNSSGLHRLSAGDARVFSRREEIRAKDTAVALLSDCSGSMKGAPMATALSASYALASVLERCNIPSECMGFTTAGFYGGSEHTPLTADQINQYQADLQHEVSKSKVNFSRTYPIYMPIFKEFHERINAEIKKRFAYQRKYQPMMGGNIDGESLEYAAMRLAKRKEKRKVIMVLSDGFPAGARGDDEHLKYMVERLTKMGFDLVGIGIKSNAVARFYDNYVILNEITDLPRAVMTELKKILMK